MNLDDFKRHLEWAEDRRSKPYYDTADPPRLTIGVGRNLTDRGLRDSEIDFMLDNDVEEVLLECRGLPYWDLLDPVRQLCVCDLVFNLGMSKWRGFVRANAALANGDYELAADELIDSAWYRQTGRRARKIVNAMRTGLWVRE